MWLMKSQREEGRDSREGGGSREGVAGSWVPSHSVQTRSLFQPSLMVQGKGALPSFLVTNERKL
jgi:hypothetical protein